MSANWMGVAAALIMGAFVAEMLRRGILRERFAALWLVVTAMLTVGALFPSLLERTASALGFEVPANLLFFTAILLLLLVAVQLSFEVSRLEQRTRRLAEDLALLTHEVRQLRSMAGEKAPEASGPAPRPAARRSAPERREDG
ncbi:MAG: DUF2304 domain-containing protein [Candidatus Nanopelagicales bacterium]